MEIFSSYNVIIGISLTLILSFIFNGIAKRTNIPAVLLLILLGVAYQYGLSQYDAIGTDFFSFLEILGIVGLIMIVLEAALELKLQRDKLVPIVKSFLVALLGLIASTYVAAIVLKALISDMSFVSALLYATPLSILSSAIIIPSVSSLPTAVKEFHIYESTFSDILGIMLFYFISGTIDPTESSGIAGFGLNILLTIIVSLIASYLIIIIFRK